MPNPRTPTFLILISVVAITLSLASSAGAATKYKVLYAFKGGTDGTLPTGALAFDTSGNLYGTTFNGGSSGNCLYGQGIGCGIVFQLTPKTTGKWTEHVLYAFQGGSDGGNPNGSPIFDPAGNLFGATVQGGAGSSDGCGTIFQLTPGSSGWTESLVFTFCSSGGDDGFFPEPGLIQDAAGNIYGMTESGGTGLGGVAFKLTPGSGHWTESVLNNFCLINACTSLGAQPVAGLIMDSSGNLYGTTIAGGLIKFGCFGGFPPGCGVVFKLTPQGGGWTESVLHDFHGPDGGGPASSLTFDSEGNLYGTTSYDGAFGFGTVFKLTPAQGRWKQSILYEFRGSTQGTINTGVVFDTAGNLYGASYAGGSCCGVAYKLTPGKNSRWKYSPLHTFSGGQDGGNPGGSLILDKQGNLYGTAATGGANGNGVVFEITP